ncbi:methylated-DNA--[protein]-cysteine S-methyltransferase [Luethyella okanaganae]|uniref:Methylated-DNA--protein-cysteine methyltransferase n=1 Tax=Luethyella okanaganae TaxID=69372 RepID=A0ABW1VBM4_9MICO
MTATHRIVDSPIGPLTLVGDDGVLAGLYMAEHLHRPDPSGFGQRTDDFAAAVWQLDEYFTGGRRVFDIELAPRGTEFQRRVWSELARIPYGETCSYLELAERLGDVGAARAVGAANGRNPISIVVPCHRVIGSDGTLTGYAGGLARKRFLLDLEEPAGRKAARLF